MDTLKGKKIAILATNGFEQSELTRPLDALKDTAAEVHVVSPESGSIRGWHDGDWGDAVPVDKTLDAVEADAYDGLVLPGGVINPDQLRTNKAAIRFIEGFFEAGKPVAAICHGPWTLIEAGAVEGRRMTSYHSIQTDLRNAGANWVDEAVVVDAGLVTSRNPDDLPVFIEKMIEEFGEGVHEEQRVQYVEA